MPFSLRQVPPRAGLLAAVVLMFVGLAPKTAAAQEMNCAVTVDYQSLSGNDFDYLDELEQRLEEYINQRTWTEDRYQEHERIDCTVQVIFEEAVTMTSFQTRLIVATRRPIYNTAQYSVVAQFNDAAWQFSYVQGGPIIHNPDQYDPLTSVLDFYVYMLLGYDYDTFSELGGTPHFEQARRIAELAQGQSAPGWSQVGSDRGRFSLVTQILDPRFRRLRTAYYDYHLNGLDRFVTDVQLARTTVLSTLRSLQELYDEVSRQYVIDLFFSAKYSELAAIFEGAPQRSEAYALLSSLDPANLNVYNRLTQ